MRSQEKCKLKRYLNHRRPEWRFKNTTTKTKEVRNSTKTSLPPVLQINTIFSFLIFGVCSISAVIQAMSGTRGDLSPGSPRTRSPYLLSPDSPSHYGLQLPSPIVTRRTRTKSVSERALEHPLEQGKVKCFSRSKGHGFISREGAKDDIFVHVSDIEGEYIPLPGDEVTFRLCPIPPKLEKFQAVHVQITNFTPEVHLRWDCLGSEH